MTSIDHARRRTIGWRACISVLLAAWLVFTVQNASMDAVAVGGLCLGLAGVVRANALALQGVATLSLVAAITWLVPGAVGRLVDASQVEALPTALWPVQLTAILALVAGPASSGPMRIWMWVLGVACLVVAAAVVLTWNPLFAIFCAPDCRDIPAMFEVDGATRATINRVILGAGLVAGGSVFVAALRLLSIRPHLADGALIGLGGALVGGVAIVAAVDGGWRTIASSSPAAPWWQPLVDWSGALVALGAITVAAGVTLPAGWTAVAERRLRALATAIEAAPGPMGIGAAFAHALGDPSARVRYPIEDGALVDAEGHVAEPPTAGERTTRLERDARAIAIVVHRAELDPGALVSGLDPGSLVALDNERLRAARLHQLEALRASRERIVQLGDTERRRIERDLHDGAQQRLLAVAMELRLAASEAIRAGNDELAAHLAEAQARAVAAMERLRWIARGIYPAILIQGGLRPALAALADDAAPTLAIDVTLTARAPAAVEAAAYAVVAELVNGLGLDDHRLGVRVQQEAGQLRLEADHVGMVPPGMLERIGDRVGAVGGELAVGAVPGGHTRLHVVLPCA